jgi:polyisoprenoid-binding protein YceI
VKFLAVGRPSMLRVNGEGAGPEGDLEINGQEVTGRLNVNLASLVTGNEIRDSHMKEKYLEVAKFQTAVLTLKPMKLPSSFASLAAAPSNAPLELSFEGELELHGTKQNVSGKVKLQTKSANLVQFDATFPLKLTDFKIGIPKYAGITIAENVDIEVHSEIARVVR